MPIIDFHNENIAHDTNNYITPFDFEKANNIFEILSVMEIVTNRLSGTYYLTSHLLLLIIVQIAHQMHAYADDNTVRDIIATMQMKFLK